MGIKVLGITLGVKTIPNTQYLIPEYLDFFLRIRLFDAPDLVFHRLGRCGTACTRFILQFQVERELHHWFKHDRIYNMVEVFSA